MDDDLINIKTASTISLLKVCCSSGSFSWKLDFINNRETSDLQRQLQNSCGEPEEATPVSGGFV